MALPRVSRPEAPSGGRSTAANGADLEWAERAIARKKLRRLHAAAAVRRRQILATLELLDSGKGPQGRKRRELGTFSWEDHVARLTQRSFKLRYRLTHDSFMKLLDTALRNWLFEQVQQSGIVRPQPRPGYHKKKRGRGKHATPYILYVPSYGVCAMSEPVSSSAV